MDSLKLDSPMLELDPPAQGSGTNDADVVDSANLLAVKEIFRAFAEEGVVAGVESLLGSAHEDCVFRPYLAGGRVLRGREAARTFFRDAVEAGTGLTLRPQAFEERGDEVVVTGSVRVQRPAGGFAESQIRWIHRFSDGLVVDARWAPRDGA